MDLPIIDVSPLERGELHDVAAQIDAACRSMGFFVIVGHGIDTTIRTRLQHEAAHFFTLDDAEKATVAMRHGGRAWRGWFPEGGELTAGVPDAKEGYYFGSDLAADHPAVVAETPLHGANLYPDACPGLRDAVDDWMSACTVLGHRLLSAMAVGLGLEPDWFGQTLTADPTILFRLFRYPAVGQVQDAAWGVAEHTDYGLLTLLAQDDTGGLEVKTDAGWVAATPIPDSFVCNLGDMLERMTGGVYRSTPHRVAMPNASTRYSFPLFFDPGWDAVVEAVPGLGDAAHDVSDRWDGRSVFEFGGRYGEYLLAKITSVFPTLAATAFDGDGS